MNMKVFVAQINPTVGDLAGNLAIIQQSVLQAVSADCDVVVLPELATVGYPPRDLLYSSALWDNHKVLIDKLHAFVKQQSRQITVIVGGLHEEMLSGGRYARYNAAWVLDRHFGRRVVHKRLLPCYDVFDETRYFTSGIDEPYAPILIYIEKKGYGYSVPCDVLICEDIWNNEYCGSEDWMKPATYTTDPVEAVARYGKGPLFVLNGSPFWLGKIEETQQLVESICQRLQQPVIWCNQVGSHDDIITGGYSMVSIPSGAMLDGSHIRYSGVATRRAKAFQEDSMVVRLADEVTHHSNLNEGRNINADLIEQPFVFVNAADIPAKRHVDGADFEMWSIYRALYLHMMDYKRRNGFKTAVLGLSGGIDSAVVAVIAAHVFGPENVTGISMPCSPYSSEGSITDAKKLADNLKIPFRIKPITDSYEAMKRLFLSGGKQRFTNDVTDENIQPRVRGDVLMAHSNDHDWCLVLTTGNKSEITVGYCTLYGDMCGGLAVISDAWKLQVYGLAEFMNKYFDKPIPEDTITKPASAELKLDQKDTDSLPPYDELDPLLQMFVEEEMTVGEVIASERCELPSATVITMHGKYRNSEYKRQQMPPGPKLSARAYGSGRRMPIACKITYCV